MPGAGQGLAQGQGRGQGQGCGDGAGAPVEPRRSGSLVDPFSMKKKVPNVLCCVPSSILGAFGAVGPLRGGHVPGRRHHRHQRVGLVASERAPHGLKACNVFVRASEVVLSYAPGCS